MRFMLYLSISIRPDKDPTGYTGDNTILCFFVQIWDIEIARILFVV